MIRISRVHSKTEYRSAFLFIAAQNPCPCGNLLSKAHECRCNELEIKHYKARLSEPFLDRIDLFVQMQPSDPNAQSTWSSKEMYEMVLAGFENQKKRGQHSFNAHMSTSEMERFCVLDQKSQAILNTASSRFGLSHRAIAKTILIARTIADLMKKEAIEQSDILEALSFRRS